MEPVGLFLSPAVIFAGDNDVKAVGGTARKHDLGKWRNAAIV